MTWHIVGAGRATAVHQDQRRHRRQDDWAGPFWGVRAQRRGKERKREGDCDVASCDRSRRQERQQDHHWQGRQATRIKSNGDPRDHGNRGPLTCHVGRRPGELSRKAQAAHMPSSSKPAADGHDGHEAQKGRFFASLKRKPESCPHCCAAVEPQRRTSKHQLHPCAQTLTGSWQQFPGPGAAKSASRPSGRILRLHTTCGEGLRSVSPLCASRPSGRILRQAGDGAVHDAKSYRKVPKPGRRLSGGGGCTRRRSSWIADRTLIGTSWQ